MTSPLNSPTRSPLRSPLFSPTAWKWDSGSTNSILDSLQVETDGMLLDFSKTSQSTYEAYALIRDTGTPANAFDGDANSSLTYTAPSKKRVTNSSGYLLPAAFNLQTYSNDFSNAAWTKTRCTATANALVESSGAITGAFLTGYNLGGASLNHRVAVEAKEVSGGAKRYLMLGFRYIGNTRWGYVVVNLADQSYTTKTDGIQTSMGTPTITSVGDGWYRVSVTGSSPLGSMQFAIGVSDQANPTITTQDPPSYTGDGVSGMLLRKAQVTDDTDTVEYIGTTSAAKYSLPIDHDSAGNPLGLLVEEARTNLCLRSEEFDNASWTVGTNTIGANATVAPDGTTTAESFIANSGSASGRYVQQAVTITTAAYTWSVFAKPGNKTVFCLDAYDGSIHYTYFDLTGAGSVGTSAAGNTATITAYPNGWYRCSVTRTAASTSGIIDMFFVDADASTTITGDGATANGYVWGAQLEAGSFPTSYIKTTSGTVTRAADDITLATSAFPSLVSAGTAIGECADSPNGGVGASYPAPFELYTDANNRIAVYGNDTNKWNGFINGSGTSNDLASSIDASVAPKFAFAWAANDAGISVNGGAVTDDDGSVTMPSSLTTLYIGTLASKPADIRYNTHIKYLKFLPRRISNADLATEST